VVRELGIPASYIEQTARRELEEIERRRRIYAGGRPAPSLAGRTLIVVDDGVATGGSVRAVLRALAKANAEQVVLAVPVAPKDTFLSLATEADEVVCLATPEPFFAVGLWYEEFNQVADEEVVRLLEEARRWTDRPGRSGRRRDGGAAVHR
jgi:putative phosphoribosyl transferase